MRPVIPMPDAGLPSRAAPGAPDLLCEVPVPLRMRMADDLDRVVAHHRAATGEALSCLSILGQGGASPLDRLRFVRAPEAFPPMLVSARHGNAFNRRFHAAHVASGGFVSGQPEGAAPVFADAGLPDPAGAIGVYAVAPFVMLVDHARLGARPVPRRWADLAEDTYRGEVTFGGWRRPQSAAGGALNSFFLLAMLRLLGPAALARLVANVPDVIHSAQMPRMAGTGASVAAIYVLPWSLADICPRRARTTIVWPEEGALAFPLWTTVQASHRDRLDVLVRHLYGAGTAAFLDRNRYPALAPGRPSAVPAGARLFWPGWDYARHRAAAGDLRHVLALFHDSRAAAQQEVRRCA